MFNHYVLQIPYINTFRLTFTLCTVQKYHVITSNYKSLNKNKQIITIAKLL